MGEYREWKRNVATWREKYGIKRFNKPNLLSVRLNAKCAKCGKDSDNRHHKGHEYLWACLYPDTYARRYLEFRPEDCVDLCRKDHKTLHGYYNVVLADLEYVYPFLADVPLDECEKFRLILVEVCDEWLKPGRRNWNWLYKLMKRHGL